MYVRPAYELAVSELCVSAGLAEASDRTKPVFQIYLFVGSIR